MGLCLAPSLGFRTRAKAVARIPSYRVCVCLHVTANSGDDIKGLNFTDLVPTANNIKEVLPVTGRPRASRK